MKGWICISMIMHLLVSTTHAHGGRVLHQSEINDLVESLTASPRRAWIESGTIEAIHEEYVPARVSDPVELERMIDEAVQAYQSNSNKIERNEALQAMKIQAIPFNIRYRNANSYRMVTREMVRTDGSRFYWDVDVMSREDSVKPPMDRTFAHDIFDLKWNKRRIFAWNGSQYTCYFRPAQHASVSEVHSAADVAVNGPLNACIIPWGHGLYATERLSQAQLSAVDLSDTGQNEIHLKIMHEEDLISNLVLDPARAYAVVSATLEIRNSTVLVQNYDDFVLLGGRWIPQSIVQERYDGSMTRLQSSHAWQITRIDQSAPSDADYEVDFAPDTEIEYQFASLPSRQRYRYPTADTFSPVDTEWLLEQRRKVEAGDLTYPYNCATMAMKAIVSHLDVNPSDAELAALIPASDNRSTLYDLMNFAQGLGLSAVAVQTRVESLVELAGQQVILHLPSNDHFVVLSHVDDRYVWLIDLTKKNFYYRLPIDKFRTEWSGTALLVSQHLSALPADATIMDSSLMQSIRGAGSCPFGCFSCTDLLQDYNTVFCAMSCAGFFEEWFQRWGCELAPSGSCYSSTMQKYRESPCIIDPMTLNCTITGTWTYYYIRACA